MSEQESRSSRRRFLAQLGAGAVVAATTPLGGCARTPAHTGPDTGAPGDSTPGLDLGSSKGTGLVYDDRYKQHQHGTERPERLTYIKQRLDAAGLTKQLRGVKPLADPGPHIAKIHSQTHVQQIAQLPVTGPVASLAVGGALGAVRAVCKGELDNAFCAIRPPGHHARNAGAEEGFCFYGNAAIAARYAQAACGVKRVLIVDWDYHHGNGTEWAFYSDPSVLFFSTHDWQAYPGTGDPARRGQGAGLGYNINVHLSCGAGDDTFVKAFDQHLLPAAAKFKPQLILISAGFDSKKDDQLGCFALTPCGYSRLTRKLMTLAADHASGRIVSLLEGGYADSGSGSGGAYTYNGLARSVEAHVATLLSGSVQKSCA
jgi:acetoin utilization deacetylase AcuC-like enzyme